MFIATRCSRSCVHVKTAECSRQGTAGRRSARPMAQWRPVSACMWMAMPRESVYWCETGSRKALPGFTLLSVWRAPLLLMA